MAKRITEEDLRVSITVGGSASGDLDKLGKKAALNRKTMSELRKESRLLQTQLDKVVPGTDDWKRLSSELKAAKDRMRELREESNATGGVLSKLKSAKAGAVALGAAAVGAAKTVVSGLAGAFNMIADFEQANANLATILGKNVKEIGDLTDSAMSLGRTTEYTASQVTLLQTELAKLGFDESQIMSMQEPILHFATAIGADLPEAASLAGAALRMFNLKSSDTENALASMVVASNKSALGFEYFNEALSTVGPVANAFGFTLQDTSALLGTLANSGFDASSAATATRNILLNLADSSGALAQKLGKPVRTFSGLIEGLKSLNEQGVDLNTTLELTDKRSVAAFNAFLTGADSAMELRNSLDDVDGELERIADERLNTVQGSIKLLQSAWEGFILQMSGSKGVIKGVIDFLTKAITKITELLFPGARVSAKADEYAATFKSEYKMSGGDAAEAKMSEMVAKAEEELASAQRELDNHNSRANRNAVKALEDNLQAIQKAAATVRASIASDEMEASGAVAASTGGQTSATGGRKESEVGKSKTKWSLNQDESYLAAKSQLAKQYAEGDIATQTEYDEKMYQLEISSLTARLALGKEKGADRVAIETQLQEKIIAQKKKAETAAQELEALGIEAMEEGTDKRLAEEELRYRREQQKFQGNAEALEAVEKKHRSNILQISIEAEQEQLKLIQQESQREKVEIENRYLERLAKVKAGSQEETDIRKEMAKELAATDLEYLESSRKLLESLISTGQLAGMAIPEDKMKEFKAQLQEVIKQILGIQGTLSKADGGIFDGTGKGELFGVSQAQWSQLFANLKAGKLSADDLASSIAAIGSAAQSGFDIASQAIEMVNAKEDAAAKAYRKDNEEKQKALEKRLDAGLMTQEQYDAEITRLQEEQDQYDEELSLRQAERQKRFNLVQAIINTALGVTKTLADWGIPAGIAPAAIMAAMGAAQVALIAATPVTSGYAEGGYVTVSRQQDGRKFSAKLSPDRRGFVTSPTMLVGEEGGEYVIPSEGLKNPSVRSMVGMIEAARVAGRLSSLKLAAVNPSAAIGYASGGYTSPSTKGGGVGASQEVDGSGAVTQQLLRKLLDRLDTPISAEVSMLGPKGIVSATEKYNRQRNRGRR